MTTIEDAITSTIHDIVADITGYEEEMASAIITALWNAGYTIIDTEVLRTALNFGYGKEPTPEGSIARANLREQLTSKRITGER